MAPRRSRCLQPQIHTSEQGSRRLLSQIQPSTDGAGVTCRRSPRLKPHIHASQEVGAGMARRRRAGTSPAASLPDEMLREILLRLPPQPSSLPRAAAVCRRWRGLVNDRRFYRHFREQHRKPPLLGVFSQIFHMASWFEFIPIPGPPNRVPPKRFNLGLCGRHVLLDCRHGLVLVMDRSTTDLFVWDPITSQQQRIAVPQELKTNIFSGAVLCAGDHGHVHGGCHTSPFKVVLMSKEHFDGAIPSYQMTGYKPLACVYSSETGRWGDPILSDAHFQDSSNPGVLVGNGLYWHHGDDILKFDMGDHSMSVIRGPPFPKGIDTQDCQIIRAEDGAVGYAKLYYPWLGMWQMNINCHGIATWVPWKTIKMDTILRLPSRHGYVQLRGYDEDGALFFSCDKSVYMVQLKPMKSKKLDGIHSIGNSIQNRYLPFKSVFTPDIVGGFNAAEVLHIG